MTESAKGLDDVLIDEDLSNIENFKEKLVQEGYRVSINSHDFKLFAEKRGITYNLRYQIINNYLTKISYSSIKKDDVSDEILSKSKYEFIDKYLTKIKSLQKLNLYDNELSSLPNSIGNLQQLQVLDLTNNELTSLPNSIGNLQQLQVLCLSSNKLTSLPNSIGNLQQLQELYLINNKLTSLPNSIGNLQQLQKLYLEDNKIKMLNPSFKNNNVILKGLSPSSFNKGMNLESCFENWRQNKLDELNHTEVLIDFLRNDEEDIHYVFIGNNNNITDMYAEIIMKSGLEPHEKESLIKKLPLKKHDIPTSDNRAIQL